MKRILSPSLNPTGLGAAIAAVYAGAVVIYNVVNHHGVINVPVIIAAFSAAWFLYTRFRVTPVADPKDGDGHPLVHAIPAPPSNVTVVPPPQP